jgi:leucyl aminopeptidase
MIALSAIATAKSRPKTELLVLPFYKGDKKAEPSFSHLPLEANIKQALSFGDFLGKEGDLCMVYPRSAKEKRVLLLGLGEKKNCKAENLRKAGAAVARFCKQKKLESVAIAMADIAFAEGLLLGAYTFDALKGESLKEEPPVYLKKVYFLNAEKGFDKHLEKVSTIADAINFTRDLVNGNADDVNAETLAETAREMAKQYPSLKTMILAKKQLEVEKMGLILAVGRGASRDPALIIVEYRGDPKSKECVALVGKGVTFDTGGLNLKPTGGIETMKCDMAGAATVLGIMKAAANLKLKINLVGALAVVENAIGPASYKPGDVYKSRSGKTVEVSNTDAEGRLILADAMTYVQDVFAPIQMIDFATLTGGIVVALGDEFSGLFSNNDALAHDLIRSGETTGDFLWRMPLTKAYRDALKSKIADLKNLPSKRYASACTAAAFLQAFIGEYKGKKGGEPLSWAHLDIAGTAYLDDPRGYHSSCATGVCIRLIIDFLEKKI